MENDLHSSPAESCPTAATADDAPPPHANESADDLRIRRIDQLQDEALANADALQANLGAFNGGLMRMGYRLEQAIEGALVQIADPLARFERLAPAIEIYLKVMRQVDRFTQLDQRVTSVRPIGQTPKPR